MIEKGEANPLYALATMGQLNARLLKTNEDYQKDDTEMNKLDGDFQKATEKLGKSAKPKGNTKLKELIKKDGAS